MLIYPFILSNRIIFLEISKIKSNIMILKLILSSGLAIIAVATIIDYQTIQLIKQLSYVETKHYNIMLTSYIENHIFFGTCNINIEISKPTRHIKFYSKVTNITEVRMFNDSPKNNKERIGYIGYKPINKPIYKNMIVEYLFNDELLSGNYTVKLTFDNFITNTEGLRIFHNRNKQW